MHNRELGTQFERKTKMVYESLGYQLVDQNFRFRGGEIDLIFQKLNSLTFVEVRSYGNMRDQFDPAFMISERKRRRIQKTIQYFLTYYSGSEKEIHVDLVVWRSLKMDRYENLLNGLLG